MNDRQTEQRMLQAAITLVQERGLSTGLESIAFDEVIREAGVSRTSAYRRWPTRDRFYGDVLVELARGATLPAPEMSTALLDAQAVRAVESPQAHRDLVVELLRVSIQADYAVASTSPQWRTYRLLLASYEGIADDEVRTAVAQALAQTERRALELRARVYAEFSALLGYRLVAPLAGPDGFEFMSRAAGATMRGVLALIALGDAGVSAPRAMHAFGASAVAEWSPAVYMVTAAVLSYIEPDPGVVWDQRRIEDLLTAIDAFRP
ncbi:MAG: TetR/AcrR family transcriptional regulator [Propioniciclava sp.]|uniref:TetR/AcrR family transcriptional regulator n=1 Tax=Propioniciclava sp. TaxID=2038686 RepID=UPI0039E3F624